MVQPRFTPPPLAAPGVVATTDLGRLLVSLNHGTTATLEPSLFAAVWPVEGADLAKPVVVGNATFSGADPLIVTAVEPGATFAFGPTDIDLMEHDFSPVVGGCVVSKPPSALRLFCGRRPRLLAFGPALRMEPRPLAEGLVLQASVAPRSADADDAVYGLRAAVPRWVGSLLPDLAVPGAQSGLGQNPTLVSALMDSGFELAGRAVDAYEALGRVELALGAERDGRVPVRASMPFKAGTQAEKLVLGALPVRVPRAFWALPRETEQAFVFDSSLLAPLLTPSARSLQLLSDARASGDSGRSFVDQLVGVSTACLGSGRAVAYAVVSGRTLLGVEDPAGKCGKALATVLAVVENQPSVAGSSPKKPEPVSFEVPKSVAKSAVKVVRLGSGKSARLLGLATRQDVTWLVNAEDAKALSAALVDLLASGAKHPELRSRTDLAQLGKVPALLTGFIAEDALVTSSVGPVSPVSPDAKPAPDREDHRVVLAVTRVAGALQVDGDLSGQVFRARFARAFGDTWAGVDYSKLPEAKRRPVLLILEGSCRLGYGGACNALGLVNAEGRGQAKDLAAGKRFLELGCNSGSGMACANLAFYSEATPAAQQALFQKSCELGTPLGCAFQGERLLSSKTPDLKLANEKLRAGCDGKVGWACTRLGLAYGKGAGVDKDLSRAADYQEQACALGYGTGCVLLAHAYARGEGRTADPSTAFKVFQQACKLDKAEGCFALALAHAQGIGTPKNLAAAREQLNVACEAKQAEACRELAEMTEEP